jgi:capsular polysaccharide biosynthesis protein
LAGALEAIGFVTVEPELLTVAQQVGLFSKAEVVVCPGGSGIFNAAFCPPSARFITIESSGRYINTHAGVFASLGMRHGIIFGREDTTDTTDIHKRWTLDIPPAIEAIESFSA